MHPSVVAQKTPDKPVIIMAGSGEKLTYGQLDAGSNQGAQLFRELGLKAGDGIAIFMENNVRYLEVCWAAQRAGLYFTCISSRLTAGEIKYILQDSGAKMFIASHGLEKVAVEVAASLRGIACFSVDGSIPGYRSYEDESAAMPRARITDEVAGTAMLYS